MAQDESDRSNAVASPAPDLISVPECARQYLDIHPESLYRLIREGEFPPAVHLGRLVRISLPRLHEYLHGGAA